MKLFHARPSIKEDWSTSGEFAIDVPGTDTGMDEDIRQLLDKQRYEAAFDRLVDRFKDKLFRLACSILHDEAQAQDVVQDAWLRIWKGLPGYTGAASLSTWIYTITRNTCFTELEKRKRRPTTPLDDSATLLAGDTLQCSAPTPGLAMDVDSLLARLPENYRRVLTLFYLEQKAYEEVAALLGLPLGTVKTLLFRAKKLLLHFEEQAPPLAIVKPSSPLAA